MFAAHEIGERELEIERILISVGRPTLQLDDAERVAFCTSWRAPFFVLRRPFCVPISGCIIGATYVNVVCSSNNNRAFLLAYKQLAINRNWLSALCVFVRVFESASNIQHSRKLVSCSESQLSPSEQQFGTTGWLQNSAANALPSVEPHILNSERERERERERSQPARLEASANPKPPKARAESLSRPERAGKVGRKVRPDWPGATSALSCQAGAIQAASLN